MSFRRPRGTRDFTPDELYVRDYIEEKLRKVIENFGYRRVETPIFEEQKLFMKKSGEEIIQHLYDFEDKGGRKLCLRPEATAPVARMYIQELKHLRKPLKLYYSGPMFRYERPQKGRYREFWQVGVELIGASTREADIEILLLAQTCLKVLGIKHMLEVSHLGILRGLLSDLGIKETDKIISLLDRGELDEVRKNVKENVLFDVIGLKGEKEIIDEAKNILSPYPTAMKSLEELEELMFLLKSVGVEYKVNLGIVRGLAYYTGMVFEIRVEGLGAQNQICGGGRYDNLIELFGGKPTPAVGFAFGFDRVVETYLHHNLEILPYKIDGVVAYTTPKLWSQAINIAQQLRPIFSIEVDVLGRKLKDQLERASEINADFVIILGEREMENEEVLIKDMKKREQRTVKMDELKVFLNKNYSRGPEIIPTL